MTTGGKIAVGCGIVVVVGIIGVCAVLIGGAYFVKSKVAEVTGEQNRIDDLKKKANAVTFTPPADGLIQEDRLVKFLDVRKRIFAVYEQHKAEIDAMKDKKQGDFSDVRKGFAVLNEARLAQAQALADLGMSDAEYQFMVGQVYKSMWASEVAKSNDGKSVSQATGDQYAKAVAEMKKAAAQAKGQASPGDDSAKKLDEAAEDMQKQAAEASESAKQLDVPPANIALFRKYEADIKKYAMGGLEMVGL